MGFRRLVLIFIEEGSLCARPSARGLFTSRWRLKRAQTCFRLPRSCRCGQQGNTGKLRGGPKPPFEQPRTHKEGGGTGETTLSKHRGQLQLPFVAKRGFSGQLRGGMSIPLSAQVLAKKKSFVWQNEFESG